MKYDKYDPRNIERGNQVIRSEERSLDYIYNYLKNVDLSKAKVPQNLGGLCQGRNIVGASEAHTGNMPAIYSDSVINMSLLSKPPVNRLAQNNMMMDQDNMMDQDQDQSNALPGLDQGAVQRILQMFQANGPKRGPDPILDEDMEGDVNEAAELNDSNNDMNLAPMANSRRFMRVAKKDR